MEENINENKLLQKFGLISDLHYGDHDSRQNFSKSYIRNYRRSLEYVQSAVKEWKKDNVDFAVDLGDIIDGCNAKIDESELALNKVIDIYKQLGLPVMHVIGNHEMYNFSKTSLLESKILQYSYVKSKDFNVIGNDECLYYYVEPHKDVKFVVLDTYEISLLGYDVNSPQYKEASDILSINTNQDQNYSLGLSDADERFVKYNGGVSKKQLKWLDEVLSDSEMKKQIVVMFGHCPLETNELVCLCWNYDEILKVMHKYNCVSAYFSGHVHDFYHITDHKGIHHLTVPGAVKLPQEILYAHLTVDVYQDKLIINNMNKSSMNGYQGRLVLPFKKTNSNDFD